MKNIALLALFLPLFAMSDTPPQTAATPAQGVKTAPAATTAAPATQAPAAATTAAPAASTTASAQAPTADTGPQERWKFGITGGLNMANFGRDLTGTTGRMGIMGGLYFQMKVGEQLYIAPSISYLQKGYSDPGYTVSSDYLEIPLQIILKKSLNQAETFKLRIFLGPQIGYQLTKTQSGSAAVGTDPGLKTLDFSVHAGLGGEMNFGSTNIFLDARYQYGLANINDTNATSPRSTTAAYSTSGILFNLGAYWSL